MVKKLVLYGLVLLLSFTSYAIPEKKFVIIVTTYNNAEWCVKNLETLFFQKNAEKTGLYQNYRIIVIDDFSEDGNVEYIEKYVHDCNQQHRVTIIRNTIRMRALANLYKAFQMCEPEEIIFNYDGDDWLAHDGVFSLINEIYQNPDIWITYGQFINWPTDKMGYCQPIDKEIVEKQWLRKKWWMPGQLRTFYAWLAHQVKLKDLLFEGPYFKGQFFPANADLAIYYPMMEMAGFHYHFISDVIYIRNVATPINDFKANKEIQVLGSKLIREKTPYARINQPLLHYFKPFENQKSDIILLCSNPAYTKRLLHSVQRLMRNIHTCFVMHSSDQQPAIDTASLPFACTCISYSPATFKDSFLECLSSSSSNYAILTTDSALVSHYIDCAQAILALEKSFAYSFFFSLDQHISHSRQTGYYQLVPPLNYIAGDIYAWAFCYAENNDWAAYHNTWFSLYRKQTLKDSFKSLTASGFAECLTEWQKAPINVHEIALCYDTAKVASIY